jgi:FixJ family two-component response regulator
LKTSGKKTDQLQPVVLIIDDDGLFRRSIKRILDAHGYSAATYESLNQFTDAGNVPQIGCAILDLNLPDSNGLEIQKRLTYIAPALSTVFLTGFGKVSSTVQAMKAGAVDFLEKPVEEVVLLRAVESAVDRSMRLYEARGKLEELRRRFEGLSPRERQVFALITAGLLNKQAAAELGLKEKTIKVHRAQVMANMGAGSFAELVKMAQRLGVKPQSVTPGATGKTGPVVTPTVRR